MSLDAMIARCRPLMGTLVSIEAGGDASASAIGEAIDAAFSRMAEVERLMSFHDPASELSRINAAPAGSLIELHPWTTEVLRFGLDLFELSDGHFDCAVGAMLVEDGMLPAHAMDLATRVGGTMAALEFRQPHVLGLRQPVCLDLGGIAKGFAVDMAIEALLAHGVAQGRVSAGGDLRVFGETASPIHVRTPLGEADALHAGLTYIGELSDGAIATSSWRDEGRLRSPGALVDPRRRALACAHRVYSVVAPSCMAADALTKVVALCGDGRDPLARRCLDRWQATAVVQ